MERMPRTLRKQVFIIRCKSKKGEFVSDAESRCCEQAYRDYPEDYSAMNGDVFEASKPAGADGF